MGVIFTIRPLIPLILNKNMIPLYMKMIKFLKLKMADNLWHSGIKNKKVEKTTALFRLDF